MAHYLPSVSQRSVQEGIDKGKGILHLYKGHRPVPLTSPLCVLSHEWPSGASQARWSSAGATHNPSTPTGLRYVQPSWPLPSGQCKNTHTLQVVGRFYCVD